ncbi:NAD(P)-dependent oxidoreductase [Coraliomargarita akajimensis]|uniref:6-phosphogluconate dehydrogenase NAD-binding protein n=1 Tax=Coraliomargarita akajimensis (strain DSM 45221 / IAM 15411 / JCM 23193 / KCTC 12865 / 04OKA010-24) TaxID=583355 RepID=D5EN31_CORAD|nr:NAD(P)-dependent oxidoreductase [Coraliomargarita akajimensis]ADE53466.1 6-phosphogluconate dehydrogenase NAD-binding protein [Coraliomargarita akajimensis DSM 45221]
MAIKRTTTKRTAVKTTRKVAAKKAPVKKRAASKTPAKKAPVRKRATKKTAAKKRAPRKRTKIGVVGLGRMGANMARRLKDCGYSLAAVYDINREAAETLASELGVPAVTTLAEVTALSEIVITVVTDDAAMKAIFTGKKDHLLKGAEGTVFINCATISPKVHMEVEALAEAAGASSLEGCMASSIPQARAGSLYLMIGGQETVFRKVKSVLSALSKDLIYVGESGSAAKVKALVNMVMNINTAALAEGLGLGAALDLDLQMLCKVFAQTGANSRVLETDAADMLDRDHDCFFSSAHAAKDSGIALKLAKQAGVATPLGKATKAQYDLLGKAGLGELDKSAVAELTFPGRYPSLPAVKPEKLHAKPTKKTKKKSEKKPSKDEAKKSKGGKKTKNKKKKR